MEESSLSIEKLKIDIQKHIEIEKTIAFNKNKYTNFVKNWSFFLPLCE